MRHLYLGLAIVGAIVPYLFFGTYFQQHGFGLGGFVQALFANGAAGGFSADLLLSSAVFWTYMFRQRGGPRPWLFIALNLTIGLSCALPAYLYASLRREAPRHLSAASAEARA